MNHDSETRPVSRRLFSAISALLLAAQIWGAGVFHNPAGIGTYGLMHPIGLLVAAFVVAGIRFPAECWRASRSTVTDLLIPSVIFTAAVFLLPPLGASEPAIKVAIALFYAASAALMRMLHRYAFDDENDLDGLWTALPFVGPFVGLFVAGISSKLAERGGFDRAVRQLPVATIALIGVSLLTALFKDYGWILFVMLPVFIGGAAAYSAYDAEDNSPGVSGVKAALIALTWVYFLLALMLLEGLVCLVMASVIAYPLAIIGAIIGTATAKMNNPSARGKLRTIPLLFVLPLIAQITLPAPAPQTRRVTTAAEVDATPARVWQVMQNLEMGTETDDLLFRLGVAMPVATRTPVGGCGGERACVLSTGTMREVITDWQPEKRLEFLVLETPECMRELGLNGKIEAPHLTGKFVCKRGVFELAELPGGRTRITGTSEVTLDVHPTAYWGVWSDEVVHRVHRRVFDAIGKAAAAAEGNGSAPAQESRRL